MKFLIFLEFPYGETFKHYREQNNDRDTKNQTKPDVHALKKRIPSMSNFKLASFVITSYLTLVMKIQKECVKIAHDRRPFLSVYEARINGRVIIQKETEYEAI